MTAHGGYCEEVLIERDFVRCDRKPWNERGCGGSGDGVGGGPFLQSGTAIQAIFQSSQVAQKAAGVVQNIALKDQSDSASEYAVSILQPVFIKDSKCVLVSTKLVPCTFTVDLTWDGEKYDVASVDFSSRPPAPKLGCGVAAPGTLPTAPTGSSQF